MRRLSNFAFALLNEASLTAGSPMAVLWTTPGIILASVMIAWGAEAAQFFVAQGIALAVLAWLQVLPEFAVEAVLAWNKQTHFLLANMTGALKLLTGLGWPMIYFSASRSYRKEFGKPMRHIHLKPDQAVQVFVLLAAIAYQFVIWFKGSLTWIDAVVLVGIYAGFFWILRKLPPEEGESLDEVGAIPRAIVKASPMLRNLAIGGLFIVGGAAVFLLADPFLRSLFGLATRFGISEFVFIAWVAPMVSEAPEGVSAYYWARDSKRSSTALMNLVSSNINQWTMLAAMLPLVLSISMGRLTPIPLDPEQSRELLLTLGQALLGALFLLNLELRWWEATGLFVLWLAQFLFSLGTTGAAVHNWITAVYFVWCGIEVVRLLMDRHHGVATKHFIAVLSGARSRPKH